MGFSSYRYTKHEEGKPASTATTSKSSVHSTPAGQYPSEGPQPGKLGVIFYYLSALLCIIGVLTMAKCVVVQGSTRTEVLVLGLSLVSSGLFCLVIANHIYNKEHRAVVEYLTGKVRESAGTPAKYTEYSAAR